ncbi:MAG: hypothetical protein HYY10_00040 [Candidatus Liptonbacteria bacterium]|nr:hypothetical protein [Candidatus Liptonbacteria bacterium]
MRSLLIAYRLSLTTPRTGFYIVEAMVALSVLVFGFLGLLTLLANSLSLNRVVADTYVANYLALEGVEIVKNVVDANIAHGQNLNEDCEWNTGFEQEASYEADWQLWNVPGSCPGEQFAHPYKGEQLTVDEKGQYMYIEGKQKTPFVRQIKVVPNDPNPKKAFALTVNSIVRWTTRGGGQFEINVEDHFYNWTRP